MDITKALFNIDEGTGLRGGLIVQLGRGRKDLNGETFSLYMRDEAFSFIKPILKRRIPDYHPSTRWGVTEIEAGAWRPVVEDLKSVAARLCQGGSLSPSDLAWVHTVDLDSGVEVDADDFRNEMERAEALAALSAFLDRVANWIDSSLSQETVLTLYGV